MERAAVELVGVTKQFGDDVTAVDNLDLTIRDGEFFSLLGPSGCGNLSSVCCLLAFHHSLS